jgi:hypothetical protein
MPEWSNSGTNARQEKNRRRSPDHQGYKVLASTPTLLATNNGSETNNQ